MTTRIKFCNLHKNCTLFELEEIEKIAKQWVSNPPEGRVYVEA